MLMWCGGLWSQVARLSLQMLGGTYSVRFCSGSIKGIRENISANYTQYVCVCSILMREFMRRASTWILDTHNTHNRLEISLSFRARARKRSAVRFCGAVWHIGCCGVVSSLDGDDGLLRHCTQLRKCSHRCDGIVTT